MKGFFCFFRSQRQTRLFCYRIRGMVNKLSDCYVTEYEVWSISYQIVLLQNTRYGQ